ncbi:hypothetical protein GOP47_0012578 [Adiantum capillus-veneris]|uniref:BHLH domain-containing protein n=1 Tax=Adiantum capillus-veneris TaxID=13818 RepID=A0A9D4ZFU4_ADICA|nr:hypothetical protein GOP47_0012578 [Adiantum capillus-veneris]
MFRSAIKLFDEACSKKLRLKSQPACCCSESFAFLLLLELVRVHTQVLQGGIVPFSQTLAWSKQGLATGKLEVDTVWSDMNFVSAIVIARSFGNNSQLYLGEDCEPIGHILTYTEVVPIEEAFGSSNQRLVYEDVTFGTVMDAIGPLQGLSKMMPSAAHLIGGIENQGLHTQEHQDALFDNHQDHLQLRGLSKRSLDSNVLEGPPYRQPGQSLSLMGGSWQEPFAGGARPLPGGQGRPGPFPSPGDGISNNLHTGKRVRGDEDTSVSNGAQPQGNGDQAQSAVTNAAAKPRVRARRGQATDPHSIAERNRRERISERMKALQELVPDSNKTDKASMLDEIINYVKFLQMQVKCLSMCRLGGAGVAAPLLADLPAEGAANFIAANLAQVNGVAAASQDGIAFAERQVARLMDEDMSAAMQYLQSKGLCLMPISLATAISSTGARQPATPSKSGDTSGGEKQAMELQVLAARSGAALIRKNPDTNVTMANNSLSKMSKEMLQEDLVDNKPGQGFPPHCGSTDGAIKEDTEQR